MMDLALIMTFWLFVFFAMPVICYMAYTIYRDIKSLVRGLRERYNRRKK